MQIIRNAVLFGLFVEKVQMEVGNTLIKRTLKKKLNYYFKMMQFLNKMNLGE